jgi:hypothetical protein
MMKKVGFIDYYLDEFHANNYVEWISEATDGELQVAHAWAKINAPDGRSTEQWCSDYGIQQVDSMEELTRVSDYIIVLSPDNPEMHEELCQTPLKSGKPVYIDKTFAPDAAAARRIFKLAGKNGTPCFSSSALRFAQEFTEIDRKTVKNITSWGPGSFEAYSIHQIEPIVSLMGPAVIRVMYIGTDEWPALVIEFSGNRRAVLSHHGWECPFAMTINIQDGKSHTLQVKSDYYKLFIKEMTDFFINGKVKVDHDETIAIIAIREAGLKASLTPGEWISVE